MKTWKLVVFYLTYTVVHFLTAHLIFSPAKPSGSSVIAQILSSLGNTVYWVQVCALYLGLLIVSSLIGMFFYKTERKTFRFFAAVGLSSALIIITVVILSYL